MQSRGKILRFRGQVTADAKPSTRVTLRDDDTGEMFYGFGDSLDAAYRDALEQRDDVLASRARVVAKADVLLRGVDR